MILSLDITISELEPHYSRGYGELEEKEQKELTDLSQKLHALLDAIINKLTGILVFLNSEHARFFKIMDEIDNNTENN